tara:strand:+ start:34 stop:642 length:609 start_codon:yes stop_codon:yes gene_type:complete
MEVKLESLIEKIKKDGIEEAEKSSEAIIQRAREKASLIRGEANLEAKKITEKAKQDAQRLKNNTESSLRQAARDLVLALRGEISGLFGKILKKKVSSSLEPDFIKELIIKIINTWSPNKGAIVEISVSQGDKEKLETLILSGLKDQVKETIEVKVNKALDKGFRIGLKGENIQYDFTDESILEALKEFLNPAIAEMLEANNG